MLTARRDHVVVTGAAGFIGSHLAEALVDRGHEVVGVDAFRGHYPAADKWSNLSGLLGRPGFELHRLDLATAEVEPLLAGAAAVFHLAARPGLRASFGPGFSGYGPRQRPDMGFRRFIEAAMAGRPLVVYGDGGQTREFTYVDDVVRASLLALTAPVEMEAVNIGGGRRVSLDDALELIGEATGRRLTVERRPPRPGDARHTGADGTRGEALLGYHPETGLAAGLAAQVAWVSQRQRAAATG